MTLSPELARTVARSTISFKDPGVFIANNISNSSYNSSLLNLARTVAMVPNGNDLLPPDIASTVPKCVCLVINRSGRFLP